MTTEGRTIYPVHDKDSANLAIDAMGLFLAREIDDEDPQFVAGMAFLLGIAIALEYPEWARAIVVLSENTEHTTGELTTSYLEQFPIQMEVSA